MAMTLELAKALGFSPWKPRVSFDIPLKEEVTNEVAEREGVLLVRLGGCSAMQVRVEPDRDNVTFRIVPIAKATQIQSDAPWQIASESQLGAWMQSCCAIWQWLLAKGVDREKFGQRLPEGCVSLP
jgi:hypothetical protein